MQPGGTRGPFLHRSNRPPEVESRACKHHRGLMSLEQLHSLGLPQFIHSINYEKRSLFPRQHHILQDTQTSLGIFLCYFDIE